MFLQWNIEIKTFQIFDHLYQFWSKVVFEPCFRFCFATMSVLWDFYGGKMNCWWCWHRDRIDDADLHLGNADIVAMRHCWWCWHCDIMMMLMMLILWHQGDADTVTDLSKIGIAIIPPRKDRLAWKSPVFVTKVKTFKLDISSTFLRL